MCLECYLEFGDGGWTRHAARLTLARAGRNVVTGMPRVFRPNPPCVDSTMVTGTTVLNVC